MCVGVTSLEFSIPYHSSKGIYISSKSVETCDDQVWISAYSHLKTHWCNEKKLEVLGFSNSSLLLFFCTVLMKRISKKMHKTVLTLWYQPYTLSVFVGFSLLDKWSAVKKRPNMTCQKLPLAHKAKMPKKEKELLETIHYFDVSHTTFSRVQLLCEKYWSLVFN